MADLHDASPSSPLRSASDPSFADLDLLHAISVALIAEPDPQTLYGKILHAAVSVARSQFGTMQSLCPADHASGHGGDLQLLCSHGLPPESVEHWAWVKPTARASCAVALKSGRRELIPDYEDWDEIVGTADLEHFRNAGIRSAQTTPLLSRDGALLGMISTHWSEPHQPSERDLRLLDILARQAADILDRTLAEEALRLRGRELEQTVAALRDAEEAQRRTEAKLRLLNETLEARVQQGASELLAAENQLRQMQKLEAIGQLTGGVAHDFNNLLMVIRSSAELLRRPSLAEEKRARYLQAIVDTADRAAILTSQLLAFARRQALTPVVFDVAERVESLAGMLESVVGSRVRLTVEPSPAPYFVDADPSQFETALVNLAVNARDAIDGAGHIVVRVGDAAAPPPHEGRGALAGPLVAVSMSDSGAGMSPQTLARIFDPFFTTKGVGKGTGLGLSQVVGFARQSGGDAGAESWVGSGSVLTIYLPLVAAPPAFAGAQTPEEQGDMHGTVLIVEDNAQVGEFALQLLDDLGFETCLVEDGSCALAVLEKRAAEFDLVFSDVVMPGMSGLELARHVRSRWPDLPVILTSGYSQVLAEDVHHGFPLLHKPFSAGELGRMLRATRLNCNRGH